MSLYLRAYGANKAFLANLPDVSGVRVLHQLGKPDVLTFSYPRSGKGVSVLAGDRVWFEIVEDNVADPDWYLLDDDGDEIAEDDNSDMIQVAATGVLGLLRYADIYPAGHSAGGSVNGLDPRHEFVGATPGLIVKTLFDKAKARGALSDVTIDFNGAVDSAGAGWGGTYDVSYQAGLDLLSAVQTMADNSWVDVRSNQFVIQMFRPGTAMAINRPDVVLRLGKEVQTGPRSRRSRREVVSHVLAIGNDKVLSEVSNATTAARFGRREGSTSDNRALTPTTLSAVARAELASRENPKEGFTVKLLDSEAPGVILWRPFIDYRIGDYVRYDQVRTSPTELTPLRVRSLTSGWEDRDSPRAVSVELNDIFLEQSLRTKARVDGILNSSGGGGGGGGGVGLITIGDDFLLDAVAPKPVQTGSISVVSDVYQSGTQTVARASVSWPPVTVNADDTPYTDTGTYLVSYRPVGQTQWSTDLVTAETAVTVDNLVPDLQYEFRVRAVDKLGNSSDPTPTAPVLLAKDTTAPPKPSAGVWTSWLGILRVTYNGLGAAGERLPGDLERVDVHVSATDGFTPSASNKYGAMPIGVFAAPVQGMPIGTQLYGRLVAVDRTGNASEPSDQVPFILNRLVADEVDAGIRTFAQDTAPAAGDEGDLWIDTNDANKMYRRTAGAWALVRDGGITGAVADAAAALSAANTASNAVASKITTFYQAGQPVSGVAGDLWINPTADNETRRYDGTNWIVVTDGRIAEAVTQADLAFALADGKIVTYFQAAPPAEPGDGDLWFETDNDNRVTRWDEAAGQWVVVQIGAAGIVPSSIGPDQLQFKDLGNLIPDGSFETPQARATLLQSGTGWSVINDPTTSLQGSYYLRWNQAAGNYNHYQYPAIPMRPGERIWTRHWIRNVGTTATYTMYLDIGWYRADGTRIPLTGASSFGGVIAAPVAAGGPWSEAVGRHTAPDGTSYVRVGIYRSNAQAGTTGYTDFDGVEVRRIVNTSIIDDAAIGNAQIANLAVNSAKISDLSVGKLTAGTLTADVLVSGTVRTAQVGARVELTAAGLTAYNNLDQVTFRAGSNTGDVDITGNFKSSEGTKPFIMMRGSVGGNPWPGLELNNPAVVDYDIKPYVTLDLSGTTQYNNGIRIGSYEYRNGSSGKTELLLAVNTWRVGHLFGPNTNEAYILGDRARDGSIDMFAGGAMRVAVGKTQTTIYNNTYVGGTLRTDGDLQIPVGKIIGKMVMSQSSVGAGVLNSGGPQNNLIWFAWDSGFFRMYVDTNNVCNITGDGRTL